MGGSVGRIVAGVASGGLSEAVGQSSKLAQKVTGVTLPGPLNAIAGAGTLAGTTEAIGKTTGVLGGGSLNAPAATKGPIAPSLSDAAKQAQLDEAKRASMTGPSDITNIGGARGILTDPNAKYVTGKLLGGA